MFKSLSITPCEDLTVRDLIRLKDDGHSVYRTSHAGNWSIYKLLMSELGLPDCIWDVTCIHRDVNNQPRYQLIGGQKIALLGEVPPLSDDKTKFLTPYHRLKSDPDMTLANFHVAPLKKLFGDLITSQSEALLEFKEYVQIVFEIIEKHMPSQLGRYVLPCGCMVHLERKNIDSVMEKYSAQCSVHGGYAEIKKGGLARSAVETLEELQKLVFDPRGYQARGGVVYSFELVVATYYLWCYWKFGDRPVYELSGPDMIGYATKEAFIARIEKVLRVICEYAPRKLYPEKIEAKIVPATVFRFGYPDNCQTSKSVMAAHEVVRRLQPLKREYKDVADMVHSLDQTLQVAVETLRKHGQSWNLFHDPAQDAFYSQHDLLASGAKMIIQEPFLDMPFKDIGTILRTLPQTERSLMSRLVTS